MRPLETMYSPQPTPGTSGVFSYRGIPANPRNLLAVSGSGKCTVSWSAPGDGRGVDRFRVYLDSESNLAFSSADNLVTQFVVQMPSGNSRMAYVSCVSGLGRESKRIPVLLSATAVATASSIPPPPATASLKAQQLTPDGSNQDFTLSSAPSGTPFLVYNGLLQNLSKYSNVGAALHTNFVAALGSSLLAFWI